MSIKNHVTGEEKYAGCVIETYEHYWLDGMLEVIAVCWNNETKTTDHVTVEYLGSDCRNMMDTTANVDLTTENARNFIRCHKMDALNSFAKSVQEVKQKIHKDDVCRVVRGRKVKKGTILTVFWCGEKPTYFAQTHRFVNEKELICGCFDESGNKVWIKAEYLEKLPHYIPKSPSAKERKKFLKAYMEDNYPGVLKIACG